MQGSMAFRNSVAALTEAPATEFIYVLQGTNTIEAITQDLTLYYQIAFLYPFKAVASGVMTPNGAAITVGKSGLVAPVTLTSLVAQGSVALATKTNHGFRPGMSIQHSGATPADYNKLKPIFEVTANTYKYQLDTAPTSPATGVVTATRVQYLPDTLNTTDLPVKYESKLGQKLRVADIIARGTGGDGVFIQFW